MKLPQQTTGHSAKRIRPVATPLWCILKGMSDKPRPAESPKEPEPPEPKPKARKEIPLISVPNDRDMIAEEMAELFDEDRVSHQHGSSEPEAD